MTNLIIIFCVSFLFSAALLAVKFFEQRLGRRLVLGSSRDRVDVFYEAAPRKVSLEMRRVHVKISLFAHAIATFIHVITGSVRTFFRRRTIKLFVSARLLHATAGESERASPFLREISDHKNATTNTQN